jgi:hypothetical protein
MTHSTTLTAKNAKAWMKRPMLPISGNMSTRKVFHSVENTATAMVRIVLSGSVL